MADTIGSDLFLAVGGGRSEGWLDDGDGPDLLRERRLDKVRGINERGREDVRNEK